MPFIVPHNFEYFNILKKLHEIVCILYKIMQCFAMAKQNNNLKILQFLLHFGFPTELNGYRYFKESLVWVLCRNEILVINELYNYLSDKFNTDPINIERGLRTLMDKMCPVLITAGLFQHRPTPRALISKCAEYISLESWEKKDDGILDILFGL